MKRGMSKKDERYHKAMERHREVGHPPHYDGPCWGPTQVDFAYVDAKAGGDAEQSK